MAEYADTSAVERVARAICKAQCVGNQTPDDLMGVLHIPAPEQTRPYRWELSIKAAQAALDTIQQGRLVEALPPSDERKQIVRFLTWWSRDQAKQAESTTDLDKEIEFSIRAEALADAARDILDFGDRRIDEALAVSTAHQDQGQRDE
jgi:hypothetical protein